MRKGLGLLIFVLLLFLFANINISKASDFRTPEIKVFNSHNVGINLKFLAFEENFRGGGRVAIGDFNGDGYGEIAVGAGVGGGPHVRIFDKNGQYINWDVFAFHQNFRGGVDIAAGDVDGNKVDELIVGQLNFGQSWIKIYRIDHSKTIIKEFMSFDKNFEGGVRLASGDVDGDGKDEIIAGTGIGGKPLVKIFEIDGNEKSSISPFHEDFRGGVDVASGDIDADGIDEIVVSQNSFGQSWIKAYKNNDSKDILGEFLAYNKDFEGGSNVSVADINNDYQADIIVGANQTGGPHIKAFDYLGRTLLLNFMAYEDDFRGGVDVDAGNIDRGISREIVTSPQRIYSEAAKYPYNKYIEVILNEQKLKYFESGRKVKEILVSSGLSFPTPVGTFNVYAKVRSALMAGYYGPGSRLNYYLPNVPYILKFYGSYTIHGAYWHNNFGHPMSHGCVNLSIKDSKDLYNWAEVGTPVIIHY